jgi:hypothetical protein
MKEFSDFVGNVTNSLGQRSRKVRVAIIDDGIDWDYMRQIECEGKSFYKDRNELFDGTHPWYFSNNDHGTLMAALVRMMCPNVVLYIGRLDQTENRPGQFQPTLESAAEVTAPHTLKSFFSTNFEIGDQMGSQQES